ncbi:type I restriction endonuclease [Helicobacter pylori]|uniref:type I restriction endonuclease n=1 Tax=Helicobacter pylori TaxID=210 RepID=UPI00095870AF|nr:type I restriction endonuclease [Helicobacter pylori]BAW67490.1 type I restriction-modification system [Helicobacter pylori]
MNFKRAIIAYFPHKQNTGNKKIIFFAIMKPLNGELKTPTNTKKGAYYHGKQKHSSG